MPEKTYKKLHEKIEHYRNLEENWDGYGAKAPPSNICNFAHELINFFEENQFDIPTPMVCERTIGFYYDNVKSKTYFEIEVDDEIEGNVGILLHYYEDGKEKFICKELHLENDSNEFIELYKNYQLKKGL